MTSIQEKIDSPFGSRDKLLINLPIFIGIAVLLFTHAADWIYFWLSHNRPPKGGFSGFLVGFLVESLFCDIIPFIVIAVVVRSLLRKGKGRTEIYIKMAFMLIPVCMITAYWLFTHIDPFARALLPFISFSLILVGFAVGSVASKAMLGKAYAK